MTKLKSQYREQGYAIIEGAVSPAALDSIRSAAEHIVDDFDIDTCTLEVDALASGVSDFKTNLRERIKREIITAATDHNMPRVWRTMMLGPGQEWD